jgi:aspartyl protease family protein
MAILETDAPNVNGDAGAQAKTPTKTGAERRRFRRMAVNLPGRFKLEDGGDYPCVCVDVAPRGVRLRSDQTAPWGSRVVAEIEGVGRIEGHVVRRAPGWIALKTRPSATMVWLNFSGLLGATAAALTQSFLALTLWACVGAATVGAFAYRVELIDAFGRVVGRSGASGSGAGAAAEFSLPARKDGAFIVPAKVNDRTVEFVFDAGAETVILTGEDAAAVGLSFPSRDYKVTVSAGNGSIAGAPAVLKDFAVGGIVIHDVPALATPPGKLLQSVLGASLLDKLGGYRTENGRLVLKGK